ncbi:hypothetical protein DFA_07858 [Cavenderia fasciculata]|uniref:Uncharacterized protein n=1 Tax=Cavenderia fasciculata TaxID=261658 RepID=F4Q3R2_CACFS|nr:uncharacterized protein DFA_07858 [Cavenderia fasciculata]EGG16878.1 hypothetical protein DFA_07858 [Cavenderia fasciculata]|eukprot:XP_004355352.1 hypothetical protein DFA_07858 [Cavenderia fasciculata]
MNVQEQQHVPNICLGYLINHIIHNDRLWGSCGSKLSERDISGDRYWIDTTLPLVSKFFHQIITRAKQQAIIESTTDETRTDVEIVFPTQHNNQCFERLLERHPQVNNISMLFANFNKPIYEQADIIYYDDMQALYHLVESRLALSVKRLAIKDFGPVQSNPTRMFTVLGLFNLKSLSITPGCSNPVSWNPYCDLLLGYLDRDNTKLDYFCSGNLKDTVVQYLLGSSKCTIRHIKLCKLWSLPKITRPIETFECSLTEKTTFQKEEKDLDSIHLVEHLRVSYKSIKSTPIPSSHFNFIKSFINNHLNNKDNNNNNNNNNNNPIKIKSLSIVVYLKQISELMEFLENEFKSSNNSNIEDNGNRFYFKLIIKKVGLMQALARKVVSTILDDPQNILGPKILNRDDYVEFLDDLKLYKRQKYMFSLDRSNNNNNSPNYYSPLQPSYSPDSPDLDQEPYSPSMYIPASPNYTPSTPNNINNNNDYSPSTP